MENRGIFSILLGWKRFYNFLDLLYRIKYSTDPDTDRTGTVHTEVLITIVTQCVHPVNLLFFF